MTRQRLSWCCGVHTFSRNLRTDEGVLSVPGTPRGEGRRTSCCDRNLNASLLYHLAMPKCQDHDQDRGTSPEPPTAAEMVLLMLPSAMIIFLWRCSAKSVLDRIPSPPPGLSGYPSPKVAQAGGRSRNSTSARHQAHREQFSAGQPHDRTFISEKGCVGSSMCSGSSSTATIVRNAQYVGGAGEGSDSKSVITSQGVPSQLGRHSSKARGRRFKRWLRRPGRRASMSGKNGFLTTWDGDITNRYHSIDVQRATTTLALDSTPLRTEPSPIHADRLPPSSLPNQQHIVFWAFHLRVLAQPTNAARRTRTTPLALSQVCSEWRTVILETRTLWSWVFVRVGEPPDLDSEPGDSGHKGKGSEKGKGKSRYPKLVASIEDWIQRTNPEQPLTIQMYFEDEESWKDRQPPDELLMVLMGHRGRWRSIDFTLPEACYEDMRFTFPDAVTIDPNTGERWTPYPLLENISLQPLLSDAQRSQVERKTLDVFKNIVPRLTHLRLNGYYVDDCHFPWAQIRTLALQHVYVDECFFVLSQTPILEECVLSTMLRNDCNRPIARAKKGVTLPMLRSLRMQSANEMGGEQAVLLDYLTLPVLRELVISGPDIHRAFSDLQTLVTRSRCEGTLKALEVGGIDERNCRSDDSEKGFEEVVIELLEGLPGLEDVRVRPDVGELGETFLAALCRGMGECGPAEEKGEGVVRNETPIPQDSLPFTSTSSASPSPSTSRSRTPPSPSNSPLPTPVAGGTLGPLLPNLRHLEYDGNGSFDEEGVMKLVRLRCPTQSADASDDGEGVMKVRRLEALSFCSKRMYSDECQALLDEAGLS
ncbi:hypothetical protein FA13DRAFT_1777368 [Coprinellus micaceus]|uniref:F-box domain-containing protein n=1 Tax=Coprinellus micaceus TaxID=71717 RepID=A0A4Y7SUS8_COPMI|nr:hypothetical protein FA13DRAFT_1777368 [Coprinellus micaceus]